MKIQKSFVFIYFGKLINQNRLNWIFKRQKLKNMIKNKYIKIQKFYKHLKKKIRYSSKSIKM